jgi:beta-lactamase class A
MLCVHRKLAMFNHAPSRRNVIASGGLFMLAACSQKIPAAKADTFASALLELEKRAGGRLGVCILDSAASRFTGHRIHERFAMCSTFKMPLAAAVLQRSDAGLLNLETVLPFTQADLMPNSPVTTENLGKGQMTIAALAEATQKTSDNAAANLLMRHIGGPEKLTAIFRSWGDDVTRVDRYEPEMNFVPAGEMRDTSAPMAFAKTAAKILTTDSILTPVSRDKLITWMRDTKTGAKRIRAGLPPSWKSGDKTGTGAHKSYANKTNDTAIFWPPGKPPIIVTCYYEGPVISDDILDTDQAVLAQVGRIAADWAKTLK